MSPANHRTIAVWIIEDHDLYRESLTSLIDKTEGFLCTGAFSSCEEAIAALKKNAAPDVMLVDIRLGAEHMSGIEGVERMRAIYPDLPFIMVTEVEEKDLVFQAICAGASGYLLKSSPRLDVIESIERVLLGGAIIDVPIARRVLNMFANPVFSETKEGLTERGKEILSLMVEGLTKREIADRLFLSRHTIDGHIRKIYATLEVHNKNGAIAKALKEHLL